MGLLAYYFFNDQNTYYGGPYFYLWNFRECNGQVIPSTITGPDGQSVPTLYGPTNTPNLKGRFAIGNDEGGSEYEVGETGGSDSTQITEANLPNHSHFVNLRTGSGNSTQVGTSASSNFNRNDDGSHKHNMKASSSISTPSETEYPDRGQYGDSGHENYDDAIQLSTHSHEVKGYTNEAGGVSSAQNIQIMPPYYVVTYIMRVA